VRSLEGRLRELMGGSELSDERGREAAEGEPQPERMAFARWCAADGSPIAVREVFVVRFDRSPIAMAASRNEMCLQPGSRPWSRVPSSRLLTSLDEPACKAQDRARNGSFA